MIYSAVFGFLFGIAIGSFFHFQLWLSLTLLLVALLLLLYSRILSGQEKLHITIASIFLVATLGGVTRITYSDLYKKSSLDSFTNRQILIQGVVVGEPDQREDNTKLTVQVETIDDSVVSPENILVTAPVYPEFHYGDKIRFKSALKAPQNFSANDDGRVFNYVGYLRAREIWYTTKVYKVELVSVNNENPVVAGLLKIKNSFKNSIQNIIPEPESSLMNGILLGAKQSLGKDILAEFQETGTSHVVVLSGYNIAIVANSVMFLLSSLSKNLSFGFGVVSIILFTILSGSGASANRAAVMVVVALFAKRFNRDYKAGRALGFTTLFLLAPNPLLLIFDPSFQLSVLATVGMLFVSPLLLPRFKFLTQRFGVRETVSTTVGVMLSTLPLLVYTTGIVSIVSLPVNVVVLGVVPTTMLFGFVTGLLGLVSPHLGLVPGFISTFLLKYILTVIHYSANLPMAYIKLPAFSLGVLVGVYLVIISGLFFLKKKTT